MNNEFENLFNELVDLGLFTSDELNLVTGLVGKHTIALEDCVRVRYGYMSLNHLLNHFDHKKTAKIYNKLLEEGFFTREELELVLRVSEFSFETLDACMYARYGDKYDIKQFLEGYNIKQFLEEVKNKKS